MAPNRTYRFQPRGAFNAGDTQVQYFTGMLFWTFVPSHL